MKHEDCNCSWKQAHGAVSRRAFMRLSGVTLAGVSLTSALPDALMSFAMTTAASNKRLLYIYLDGGCDALNTIIPHGDPQYNATLRPTLYVPPAQAINLNGFASLHKNLAELNTVYTAGDLAVVHRVGYPDMTQSHFDGKKIWQFGNPAVAAFGSGWLYRYLITNGLAQGASLPALNVNYYLSELLQGQESIVNIADPNSFDYGIDEPVKTKFRNRWSAAYTRLAGTEPYRELLAKTGVDLISTTAEYASWDQANWNPKDPNTGWSLFPVDDNTNPTLSGGVKKFSTESYPFFLNLKICALSLLEGGGTNGTRIAATELGGFDSHDGQGLLTGQHPDRLSWLGYGIQSLRTVLSGAATNNRSYGAIWNDTCVVTASEFGRTSAENGSSGTDHGQASFSLVAGGLVKGGVYNCDASNWFPGTLFEKDGFYFLHRTDYRALLWEVLRDHMGASLATVNTIFPGYTGLGLVEPDLF